MRLSKPGDEAKIQPRPIIRANEFTKEQVAFILYASVYIGPRKTVKAKFEEKYGVEVHTNAIGYTINKDASVGALEKIRREYDRNVSAEFLASKRARISKFQGYMETLEERYEMGDELEALKLASDQVSKVTKEMEPRAQFGDIHIQNFQQNNKFADMPLDEIIKEEAAVLLKLKVIKTKENKDADT